MPMRITPAKIITAAFIIYLMGHIALWFAAFIRIDQGRIDDGKDYVFFMVLWGPIVITLGARYAFLVWRANRHKER